MATKLLTPKARSPTHFSSSSNSAISPRTHTPSLSDSSIPQLSELSNIVSYGTSNGIESLQMQRVLSNWYDQHGMQSLVYDFEQIYDRDIKAVRKQSERDRADSQSSQAYAFCIERWLTEKNQILFERLAEVQRQNGDLKGELYRCRHDAMNKKTTAATKQSQSNHVMINQEELTELRKELTEKDKQIEALETEIRRLKNGVKSMKENQLKKEELIVDQIKTFLQSHDHERGNVNESNHVYTDSFEIADLSEKIERLQHELKERCRRDERQIALLNMKNLELEDEIRTMRLEDTPSEAPQHIKSRTLSSTLNSKFSSMRSVRSMFSSNYSVFKASLPDPLTEDRSTVTESVMSGLGLMEFDERDNEENPVNEHQNDLNDSRINITLTPTDTVDGKNKSRHNRTESMQKLNLRQNFKDVKRFWRNQGKSSK